MISNKSRLFSITFFALFSLLFNSDQIEAQNTTEINNIVISEYNMSVLSVNQNDQILSIITAVKIENQTQETFTPNFTNVESTGMNFLRFSLPKGYEDLYVETDLPEGNLIELEEGFAFPLTCRSA